MGPAHGPEGHRCARHIPELTFRSSPSGSTPIAADTRLARLRRFAWWLDEGIQVPGTRFRIGLDPILGLVPVIGDVAGAVLAASIFIEAVRRGASRFTLARMAYNIAMDTLIGVVPLVGDAFDAAWKANLWNVALLERQVASPAEARRADRLFVVVLSGGLVLLCAALLGGGMLLTARLLRVLFAR